jgi:hypothetical protein
MRKVRNAFIRKIKAGQWVRSPGGNSPERTTKEMIEWLRLKPGTDIEYKFHETFQIHVLYSQSKKTWIYKLTDCYSIHNVYLELAEDEL